MQRFCQKLPKHFGSIPLKAFGAITVLRGCRLNTSRNGTRGEHRWMPILQRGCCDRAHVSRSHRSNSIWRSRLAVSTVHMVLSMVSATATDPNVGHRFVRVLWHARTEAADTV
jgi:hypothetical protein